MALYFDLVTPTPVNGIKFYEKLSEGRSCQKATWGKVSAGNCGNEIQYTVEIITTINLMSFNVIGNNSLKICNASTPICVSLFSSFNGRTSERSKFYRFMEIQNSTENKASPDIQENSRK